MCIDNAAKLLYKWNIRRVNSRQWVNLGLTNVSAADDSGAAMMPGGEEAVWC